MSCQAHEEAVADLLLAAKASPADKGIRAELEQARKRVSEDKAKQKAAYARMLKPAPELPEPAAGNLLSARRHSVGMWPKHPV